MLALLDKLRGAVRDFAAREQKLNGAFRAKSAAELQAFEAAKLEQTSGLAERVDGAEAAFQTQKTQCQSGFERRKDRINRAHAAVRKRVMDGIREQEGHGKYKVQQGVMETERRRDADLAAAAAALEEFKHKLSETRDAFVLLESESQKTFRGYGKLRRLLACNRQWPEPDLSPT